MFLKVWWELEMGVLAMGSFGVCTLLMVLVVIRLVMVGMKFICWKPSDLSCSSVRDTINFQPSQVQAITLNNLHEEVCVMRY